MDETRIDLFPPRERKPYSLWQPISTAPKPNVDVLLWYPWKDEPLKNAPPGYVYIGQWACTQEDDDYGWRDPVDFELIGSGATHWMPLPAPPAVPKDHGA